MKVCIEIEPDLCPYWDYSKGSADHTCHPCSCYQLGNMIGNIHYGLMIDGNRYCMLNHDIRAAIIEPCNE